MGAIILLVDDNERILSGNKRMLKRRGFEVRTAPTLARAREELEAAAPDLIVLDIMLPDGNGLDFLTELRRSSNVPVLLLTGLTAPDDVVSGFKGGCDDYLTKPYDFGVLEARIEALLRRAGDIPKNLRKGAVEFDVLASRAVVAGVDLLLTPKEFSLLFLLAKNERKVMTAKYLYETLWNLPYTKDVSTLKILVSRLRRKIGENFLIENDSREGGYIFTALSDG
ncbi:MAG: response regulator transcription factor [Deltaproteobacteria bacterium]|jgi:DNA-binding response OmpR family regulator|nr:response regulator transcription factor [Deltaproteobacteria bacterium]